MCVSDYKWVWVWDISSYMNRDISDHACKWSRKRCKNESCGAGAGEVQRWRRRAWSIVAQWLAHWAHNPRDPGSKPGDAMNTIWLAWCGGNDASRIFMNPDLTNLFVPVLRSDTLSYDRAPLCAANGSQHTCRILMNPENASIGIPCILSYYTRPQQWDPENSANHFGQLHFVYSRYRI